MRKRENGEGEKDKRDSALRQYSTAHYYTKSI